jgi:hypothetical protein
VRDSSEEAIFYSGKLNGAQPDLPILLMTNRGEYVPDGTLGSFLVPGSPEEFINTVASMLKGSVHIRDIPGQALLPKQ